MPLEPRLLVLADRLIEFVLKGSGFQVVVCDETGTIVRATLHKRLGTVHSGAVKLLKSGEDEYMVTKEEAATDPLVKEGLNYPIVVNGRRVGTFGVAASPFIARPLARVCSLVLSSWLGETPDGPSARSSSSEPVAEEPWRTDRIVELTRKVSGLERAIRSIEQKIATAAQSAGEAAAKLAEVSAAINEAKAVVRLSVAGAPAPIPGSGKVERDPSAP
jgi:Putative sugar diacid recognition